MAMNWPTFFTRLGSAVVFAAVMMCGLLWKDWMFVVLVGVIMVLCLREYFRLTQKINTLQGNHTGQIVAQLLSISILIYAASPLVIGAVRQYYEGRRLDADAFFLATILYIIKVFFYGLTTMALAMGIVAGIGLRRYLLIWRTIAAMSYITLPCSLLLLLRMEAWYIPLILILCIWMNDTMAYIVGSFIGKTPFSKISPKKTWEGTIGGALLAVVGAAVAAHFIPGQSMPLYIALALCAAIAGTAGDLFESKLKRMAGVKDSGTMMPGHGGALDRFDSLLVATPFAFCAVYLVQAFT